VAIHLRGVVRGLKIELESDPGLPAGSRVDVTIDRSSLSAKERRKALKKLCGVWRDDASVMAVFEGILADRLKTKPRLAEFDVAP